MEMALAVRITSALTFVYRISAFGGPFPLRLKYSKRRKQISHRCYFYNYPNAVLNKSKNEINITIMNFYPQTILTNYT